MKMAAAPLVFVLVLWLSQPFQCPGQQSDPAPTQPAASSAQARLDLFGDPLPAGAKLRLGTVRLRQGQGLQGVAFSPDGKLIASCGWQEPMHLWDVATGRPVRQLYSAEGDGNFAVAFSPDGTKLASVSESGFVRLWDVETGEVLSSVKGHDGRTYGVTFAPDGSVFATAGSDAAVRVWDVATGAELLELTSAQGGGDSRPVAFSPDGKLLASGSSDGALQIWDLSRGGEPRVIPQAHGRDVVAAAFIHDGKTLLSGGSRLVRAGDRGVRMVSEVKAWNVADGTPLPGFEPDEELSGEATLALSPDGSLLASSHAKDIVIWNPATRQPLRVIDRLADQPSFRTQSFAISPDNRLVASQGGRSTGDNKVYLWNIATGEPILLQEDTHTAGITATAISPDGRFIATGSQDGSVRLWDASTGAHLRQIDEGTGWVRYVEFFPRGGRLAIGRETRESGRDPTYQGEVKICRVSDGQVIHHFRVPDRVTCGAISPDGSRLAAGIGLGGFFLNRRRAGDEQAEPQCKIFVWDADFGGQATEIVNGKSRIEQLKFAPIRDQLWAVDEDRVLRKWNERTGAEIATVELPPPDAPGGFTRLTLVLGLDKSHVAMGFMRSSRSEGPRGGLVLRKIDDPQPLWEKPFAQWWPNVLAASSDGRILATHLRTVSGSAEKDRITLWSAADGRELIDFELNENPVRSLAFSVDGTLLVSGMEYGDALVWDISAAYRELE